MSQPDRPGFSPETIARLRAKSLSRPVPEPTAASRAAYASQLRRLGADDDLVNRLLHGHRPARWWQRVVLGRG